MKKHLITTLLFGILQLIISPNIFVQYQSTMNNNVCNPVLSECKNTTTCLNNSLRKNRTDKNMVSVTLKPESPSFVKASEIVQLYSGDWEYAFAVTLSGYTATDDLWTILSYNNINSDLILDAVQLTIHAFEPESNELENCIQDIIEKAKNTNTTFKIYMN